eukprot:TRINITY_DN67816_c0_g1_i1.p1 TRINITY_DN67816_c0_g1~~TRINITY_DN67816_c0_g1_i1.p1  ORF type:complete len:221 (-),score=16.08 TRINITY_DN67816_c0_g1_i1:265-927(-)
MRRTVVNGVGRRVSSPAFVSVLPTRSFTGWDAQPTGFRLPNYFTPKSYLSTIGRASNDTRIPSIHQHFTGTFDRGQGDSLGGQFQENHRYSDPERRRRRGWNMLIVFLTIGVMNWFVDAGWLLANDSDTNLRPPQADSSEHPAIDSNLRYGFLPDDPRSVIAHQRDYELYAGKKYRVLYTYDMFNDYGTPYRNRAWDNHMSTSPYYKFGYVPAFELKPRH